jgi:hypothetical protein
MKPYLKYLILAAVIVILFIAVYFVGRHQGKVSAIDNIMMDSLNRDIANRDNRIKKSELIIEKKNDTIKLLQANIAITDALMAKRELKSKQTITYYETLQHRYVNVPVSHYDRFIWARFPDSVSTMAKRGDRP